MEVVKRNGEKESVKFDKIVARIKKQTYDLNRDFVDPLEVAKKVIQGVYDGVTTKELDNLSAETSASMIINHPDYSNLAARIAISALHKDTKKSFIETIDDLYNYINPKTGEPAGMIAEDVYKFIKKNAKKLEQSIIHDRDFNYDYFGFKTLEKSYLLKIDGNIVETPQHMLMRVSCGIWKDDIEQVLKTYDLMSQKLFTHATPTLFNAGTVRPQMSSCFLLQNEDDSIEGIFKTYSDVAKISKNAGGIGVNMNNIRGTSSYIRGTNGNSNGLIPFLKILNEIMQAIDQGGGKRKGAAAVYLEPWHTDILPFLDLRKNHGKEEMRARDLFLAIWTPDLFMKRVKEDSYWTLFSPNEVKDLNETYGEEFNKIYEAYEKEGKGKRVQARAIWNKIIESQIETGTPYILFKDAINQKSNQKNIGIIRSSNLCSEILEATGVTKWQKENHPDKNINEVAVCNLASLSLSTMVDNQKNKDKKKRKFNFDKLYESAYQAVINLNKVIDNNFYPVPEAEFSNMNHRPIGLGVQGLADAFAILGLPFESELAKHLNRDIFETIYFAALTASKDLAKKDGHYNSYKGSPISEGIFQFNMWGLTDEDLSGRWDWKKLKEGIKKYGVRNSLLTTQMPTASTSSILGNNESFEPFTTNMYKRGTLSGEHVIINKYLIQDLIDLNLWNQNIKLKIIAGQGSIQNIPEIPTELKEIYKTIWEIKQKTLIDYSADRAPFICQTQSLNIFMENANAAKISSALFYAWEKGLKTGMYYLRTKSASAAIQGLGIDMSSIEAPKIKDTNKEVPKMSIMTDEEIALATTCSLDNPEACEACSG